MFISPRQIAGYEYANRGRREAGFDCSSAAFVGPRNENSQPCKDGATHQRPPMSPNCLDERPEFIHTRYALIIRRYGRGYL